MDELEKDGLGLGAPLGTHSDLPHRGRQRPQFPLIECQEPSRDALSWKLLHLFEWAELLGISLLQLVHDAVFWDVSGDFLRFRQRADPLVIELFRSRVCRFLQNVLSRKRHSSGNQLICTIKRHGSYAWTTAQTEESSAPRNEHKSESREQQSREQRAD